MKYTIAVDFDGVIHRYSRGWQDGTIYDPPVTGAVEWLNKLLMKFDVVIFSSRAESLIQRHRMRTWLKRHAGMLWYDSPGGRGFENIRITNTKPPALVYVDDRGFRFEGTFPTPDELHQMRPFKEDAP